MNAEASQVARSNEHAVVRRRIDAVGWGLLLVLTGGALLMPDQHLAEVAWLIGVGLILLGANAVRYLNGMRMQTANFVLGSVALAGGVAAIFGVNLPLIPIVLILFGVSLLISPLIEKDG
jgi:hypothetical protein